ncbi:MAG: GNAT family N-acetyltransferase [bacterium]|nr:GNAT family N-acetyltransferase [bacterium]
MKVEQGIIEGVDRETSSIYFSCILKKEAEGIVWTDEMDLQGFLLVWSPYQEGFQLMGQPLRKEEWGRFRTWFEHTIPSFLKAWGMECFEYGADTKELADMFDEIFRDKKILSEKQKIFHWSGNEVSLKQPDGYQIKLVDREFLEEEYKGKEFITEEIKTAYGTLTPYFDHGIAYVAIKDNEIVARADMLFSNGTYGNISIHTKEEHRRKGLASYLAMKTIKETVKRGLIPIWDCTESNLASEKTANRCGFQMVREDIISWFMV